MKLKGLKFGIFIILGVLILSGCGSNRSSDIKKTESVTDISKDDKDEKLRFNEVSVSFPSVKPHYVDEVETLPDDLKIDSTMGSVRDITIKNDYIYYYGSEIDFLFRCCERAETGSGMGDVEHGHVVVVGFVHRLQTLVAVQKFLFHGERFVVHQRSDQEHPLAARRF